MTDWWTHTLEGKVVKHRDTPLSILGTLEDWFDGSKSAMRRFQQGQPVSARVLLREIEKCFSTNTLDEEIPRLKELRAWAIREEELARTAKELRDARKAFEAAVESAGLDPYYASRIVTES